MNKNILIFVFVLVILSSLASAYTLDNFTDGTTKGNFTFITSESFYKNISLPYWASINLFTIDLKGYLIKNSTATNYSFGVSKVHTLRHDENQTFVQLFTLNHTIKTDRMYWVTGGDNFNFTMGIYKGDASWYDVTERVLNGTGVHAGVSPVEIDFNNDAYLYPNQYYYLVMNYTSPNNPSMTIYGDNPESDYKPMYYNRADIKYHVNLTYNSGENKVSFNNRTVNFYFNLTEDMYPTNLTIKVNGSIAYENLSKFNGSMNDINLNASLLQNCVDACTEQSNYCNCSINFTAAMSGILEYSGIDILYYRSLIDNCTGWNTTALNISFYNESDDSSVEATFDILFTHGNASDNLTYNYSLSVTDNSYYDFCIKSSPVYSDVLIDYEISGTTYEYHLINFTLTSDMQSLYLYSTTGTTRVTFTVTDLFDDPINGAYIKILKYDVGTHTYKTVEVLKTNNDGESIGNIILYTDWYRFIIEYNSITYIVTDPSKIFDTTKVFRIDLTASDWFANYDITIGAFTNLNFTNSTLNFAYTWNDPSGAMHQGCLQVMQINRTIERTICDNCTTSTAATILCNIGSSSEVQGKRYIAQGYFKYDLIYITDILEKIFGGGKFQPLWERGAEEREYGVFLSFLMITSMGMIGIWSPVTAITLVLVGLFVTSTLGFLKLPLTALMALIILGMIVIYKISRNN